MIILFILNPLGIYSLFSILNYFLPSVLIYLFFSVIFYYSYKKLMPFFLQKKYFLGFQKLFKSLFKYIWTQKIVFFFLLIGLPNLYLSLSCCLKNGFKFYYVTNYENIINFMVSIKTKRNQTLASLRDIISSLEILKLNPLFSKFNEQAKEKMASSFLHRAWFRNPTFFKKCYGNALYWSSKTIPQMKSGKTNFYEIIASMQSSPYNSNLKFKDLQKLLLNDQGHPNIIRNDEFFVYILLAEQLDVPIQAVYELKNGYLYGCNRRERKIF